MMKVCFYDHIDDALLKFAVIISQHNRKWVLCKHKEKNTYEVPGGHRELHEQIFDTAKRELREETGAVDFTLNPICVYSVKTQHEETFGMLYYAEIYTFEDIHSEIETIIFTDHLDIHWTYPLIQPKLIDEAIRRHYCK